MDVSKIAAPAPPPLALFMVIDKSGSMTMKACDGTRLQNSINVSRAIVESLPPDACCGIVEFRETVGAMRGASLFQHHIMVFCHMHMLPQH